VIVEETRLGGEAPELHPLEAQQIAAAVSSRRLEFAVGRACAHRALTRLEGPSNGTTPFALLNGPDRAPRWPPGIVGAITHTGKGPGGYCGAVVARSTDLLTVGLDAEGGEALEGALWSFVLTEAERRRLTEVTAERAGVLGKIIFSAKECFYKAQFPLTHRFLDFKQVEVLLDQAASMFEIGLTDGTQRELPVTPWTGRYLEDEGLVFTGIAIPT
jgi:4'-phosphopantetheinyl transferase EntD